MAWIISLSGMSAGAGSAVRGTALLVDDDITYSPFIGEMLTEDGGDMIETSTGEDALTFSGSEGKPTLLVTNLNLVSEWTGGPLAGSPGTNGRT